MDMVEGLKNIETSLVDEAVLLISHKNGSDRETSSTSLKRDLDGIAKYIFYSRNARGWGGTLTQIEVAAARVEHVENVISYYVTELFGGDMEVLGPWYKAWSEEGI